MANTIMPLLILATVAFFIAVFYITGGDLLKKDGSGKKKVPLAPDKKASPDDKSKKGGAEYATSPLDFRNLLSMELQVVKSLLQVKGKLDRSNEDLLNQYLDDFNTCVLKDEGLSSLKGTSKAEVSQILITVVKHPFKIYRTLWRISKRLPKLLKPTLAALSKTEAQGLSSLLNTFERPNFQDLTSAARSVLKVYQTYKYSIEGIKEGHLGSSKSSCGLNSDHLAEIAKVASGMELYSQAVDFLDVARGSADVKDGMTQNLAHLLQKAIENHDALRSSTKRKDWIQVDSGPLLFEALLHHKGHDNFLNRVPLKEATMIALKEKIEQEDPDFPLTVQNGYAFERACRGEGKPSPHLKCYLSTRAHEQYILSPLKVEVHSRNPLLLQYHDVLSEVQIEAYKQGVDVELTGQSRISELKGKGASGGTSRHRTYSTGWIKDFEKQSPFHPWLLNIGRLLGYVDVESKKSCEPMQIAAYSPGGLYVPHRDVYLDNIEVPDNKRLRRIITFMMYLTDVEDGGATMFPLFNSAVFPSKGSAVMWYNYFPNGTVDERMLRGECSVALGTKWIANKWIHSDAQMFRKKCGVEKFEDWRLEDHI